MATNVLPPPASASGSVVSKASDGRRPVGGKPAQVYALWATGK